MSATLVNAVASKSKKEPLCWGRTTDTRRPRRYTTVRFAVTTLSYLPTHLGCQWKKGGASVVVLFSPFGSPHVQLFDHRTTGNSKVARTM